MPRQLTVAITGSSAGLWRAIAHAYAKRGARIGLIARNPEALDAAKQECERLGGQAICCPTDVADADAVERAATSIEDAFGPIDVWINDAMVSVFSPVKEMEASDYRRITEVLYLGFVHGTLAALRRMLPRDRGTIIQIGSALSYRSIPLQSACCACKHAINGFTDSLRCELVHDNSNIKITNIQMPAMNITQFDWVKNRLPDMTQPVPPIYEPEVAAEVVYGYDQLKRSKHLTNLCGEIDLPLSSNVTFAIAIALGSGAHHPRRHSRRSSSSKARCTRRRERTAHAAQAASLVLCTRRSTRCCHRPCLPGAAQRKGTGATVHPAEVQTGHAPEWCRDLPRTQAALSADSGLTCRWT